MSLFAMPRRLENYHHPRHLLMNLQVLDRLGVAAALSPELIPRSDFMAGAAEPAADHGPLRTRGAVAQGRRDSRHGSPSLAPFVEKPTPVSFVKSVSS